MRAVKSGSKRARERALLFLLNCLWWNDMRWLLIIIGCLAMSMSDVVGQSTGERCRYIGIFNEPTLLDTLSAVPGSIYTIPEGAPYTYDINSNEITIRMAFPPDSIRVCYQAFPLAFNKTYQRDRQDAVSADSTADSLPGAAPLLQREEIFATTGISKSGTISRGVSFGNNQDVFVNSTLNLNLDGRLTDDLNIRASITDQNIPFQPEGNTQQLQDFDNVFVEIYNEQLSLLAGDIVFQQQPSQFLRYYKNVQGGKARYQYPVGNSEATSSIGLSVAKGQFETTRIEPREGVLGPYRIPGPDGQPFVIILANSERIYVDGRLLERGFNKDYVIDYNQGQITFTNRVLITEFTRIRIDYEYSDQNYNRSILAGFHEQQTGKWKFGAQVYREADIRNKPLFGSLSNEDKLILSLAGDNPNAAVTSGADSAAYSPEEIRYQKVDTTLSDGSVREIFRQSNDPERAQFRVRFTQTSPNGGDYVLDRITANGRIYKWVAPVNGLPQGSYVPFIRLPAPNKRQMVTLSTAFVPNDHEEVYAEAAFSNHDMNLYSTVDDQDNNGMAIKTGIRSKGRAFSPLKGYTWHAFTDVEFDQQNFRAIDRFRRIEFNRDWNYDALADSTAAADRILNAGIGIEKSSNAFLNYQLSYRNRTEQVDGFQHRAAIGQKWKSLRLRSDLFHMTNEVEDFTARWTRIKADLAWENDHFVPGYIFELDRNIKSFAERDTSAMSFIAHEFYIHQGKESLWEYDLRFNYREDDRPLNGVIQPYSTSRTTRFMIGRDFENHRLQGLFTYRHQDLVEGTEDEESISSRIEYQGSWFGRSIRTDITYAVLNSQELRREYVFIRVPTGEGTHTWRDLNEDGIQDFNEFFIAINPDERNYAKIFVPTDEFVTAFQNLFITQLRINLPSEWKDRGGLAAFLTRISNNTSFTADNKITSDVLADKLFAFARDLADEDVLSRRNIFRSTTFFNRSNSSFGMEFTLLNARRKQLLTSGFEGNENRDYNFMIRYNPSQLYNFKLRALEGRKTSFSDFLPDRNYLIRSRGLNPEVAWQPGIHHRLTIQYSYEHRENLQSELPDEQSVSNEVQLDYRFAKAASSVLQARLSYIEIAFAGQENTPVGYELLNALRPGRNLTWSLVWQQKITNGLQLNISYDGRSSENTAVIHTGRIQVSALF